MRKRLPVSVQIAEYEKEIVLAQKRWRYIKKYGCSDPFWPDGCNMNLVRNHIIYYLMKIQELSAQPVQLSLFDSHPCTPSAGVLSDKRIPPKVDTNFMATKRKLVSEKR